MRLAFCFLPPFLPQLFQVVGGEPLLAPRPQPEENAKGTIGV